MWRVILENDLLHPYEAHGVKRECVLYRAFDILLEKKGGQRHFICHDRRR